MNIVYTNTGYYDNGRIEEAYSDKDFFVHCSGHYKLVNRELFFTDRKEGTTNYQLLYIADGMVRFRIEGKMQEVVKGHCVLYRPGEPQYYEYRLSDHADVYWIHFSYDKKTPFLSEIGMGKESVFSIGTHSAYIKLFDQITQELQLKKDYFTDIATLELKELLFTMARNRDTYSKSEYYTYYPQVEAAIRRFSKSPEENFTIKQYTKENNLNYYRFIDSFTKVTGIAPRQYIINIRMSKAKGLLANEGFSVTDVAELVGYENALYFSRLFRKIVGVSPSEYRKQVVRNGLT